MENEEYANKILNSTNLKEIITCRVNSFYKFNSHYYKIIAMDVNDLIQECYFLIIELLPQYPNLTDLELFKFCNTVTGLKLSSLRLKGKNRGKRHFLIKKTSLFKYNIDTSKQLEYLNYHSTYNIKKLSNAIKACLNEKDYDLINKKLFELKTFEEIGQDFNFTKQRAEQKYRKIIAILASKLNYFLNFQKNMKNSS